MDKALVGMEESAGAVIRRCSVNNVSWKITQNSQENMCWSPFIMKSDSSKDVFL